MSPQPDSRAAALTGAPSRAPGTAAILVELTKPRLSGLVVVTTAVGYLLGARSASGQAGLLPTLLGTFLLSGGACAFNMLTEARYDALMARTRARPLPAGLISRRNAALYSFALSLAGLGVLYRFAGPLTAGLGLATIIIYLAVYTPMKRRTSLCTVAGALVGAIPPVMGWTAATGRFESGALFLGAILFIWQIPHFLAIAWMHRDDYEQGGFRMLPAYDPTGATTFSMTVLYSVALLPVSLVAGLSRPTGWLYPMGAVALGLGFLVLAVRLYRDRSRSSARRLFLASLAYLPLLILLLAFDPTAPGRSW